MLHVAGNTFIFYLSQSRLDVHSDKGLFTNAIKCSIASVTVVTFCGWLIQDTYLTMFYSDKKIKKGREQLLKVLNSSSDSIVIIKSDQ